MNDKPIGLIGKNVKGRYSKFIYSCFIPKKYENFNIKNTSELDAFFTDKNFEFVNVTAPYKKAVIDYCDTISGIVKKTGACNLIINRDGVLRGFNTDAYGFEQLLILNSVKTYGKDVLILGNGATSSTIKYVVEKRGASKVVVACRTKRNENEVLFSEIDPAGIKIIINSTPVGKENDDANLINLKDFPDLETVIDVSYKPQKTNILIQAKELGKGSINGLWMLIKQAELNFSLVYGTLEPNNLWSMTKHILTFKNINLVVYGMPTSGKTKLCEDAEVHSKSDKLFLKRFIDSDKLIEDSLGMSISTIFTCLGEQYFRNVEKETIKKISKYKSSFISLGGGAIVDDQNYINLSRSSLFIYLKKTKFDDFVDDGKRPLIKTKEDLERLYKERSEIYERRADIVLSYTTTFEDLFVEVMDAIFSS